MFRCNIRYIFFSDSDITQEETYFIPKVKQKLMIFENYRMRI